MTPVEDMIELLREAGFDASYIAPNGKAKPACSACVASLRRNQVVVHQTDCPNGIAAGDRFKAQSQAHAAQVKDL